MGIWYTGRMREFAVMTVSALCVGVFATPGDAQRAASCAIELQGRGIRISFDAAEGGFGCLGIENRLGGGAVAFGHAAPGEAGFWRLDFRRGGNERDICALDNRSPCAERRVERSGDALVFTWKGLSPGGEKGVVDVRAMVSLTSGGDAAEWRIAVENRSGRWGLAHAEYPVISRVVRPGEASALLPLSNWGGCVMHKYSAGHKMPYPGGCEPVQTFAFMQGGAGLQFTALDGGAQEKTFDTTGLDARIAYHCPDAGRPGAAHGPDYAVETAAFTGGWWRAAKRYRAWAEKQKWTAKGPLAKRADFSRRIGDVGLWMCAWGAPAQVSNATERALAALGDVPLGVHWYGWHRIPFDNSYPRYFPEKPGMRGTVDWMKRRGVLVMPYINARLWDSEISSFTNALSAACKMPDGKTPYIEVYGSKRRLSPMCPATPLWREKLDGICAELMERIGVNAIYLDQVACARPAGCHDASHGHPLGGGRYWTEGYRELMAPIRRRAAGNGVALTTECVAEPYIDSFDGMLTWFQRWPRDVPLVQAVYSGYMVFFGSPQSEEDSLDAYCAMQGWDFLWGTQPGWNGTWLFDDAHREHLAFTLRLCRERLAHKDFFVEGELLGELPIPQGVPQVAGRWRRKPGCSFRLPAAMGSVWRALDGRRLVCLVNISGCEQRFEYRLRPDGPMRVAVLPPRSAVTEVVGHMQP